MEAFELSGCDDRDAFWAKLNRLVKDGLPTVSRLNTPGSCLETTPPFTWINCDLCMNGCASSLRPERIRPEHQRADWGAFVIGEGVCLPIVRVDVLLSRAVFLKAWKAIASKETHQLLTEPDVFDLLGGKARIRALSERDALELVQSKDPRWRQAHGPGGNGTPGVRAILARVMGNRKRNIEASADRRIRS